MTDDYGHDQRARALAMSEEDLRLRVDRLLEQCAREIFHPPLTERGGMLYATEIYWLLGVGPHPGAGALAELAAKIDETERP